MKYTEKYMNEFEENELLEELKSDILSGWYNDLDDLIYSNREYIESLTDQEEKELNETFAEWKAIQEEQEEEAEDDGYSIYLDLVIDNQRWAAAM